MAKSSTERVELGELVDTPFHTFTRPTPGYPLAEDTWSPGKPGCNYAQPFTMEGYRPEGDENPAYYPRYNSSSNLRFSQQEEHQVVGVPKHVPVVDGADEPKYASRIGVLEASNPNVHPEQYNKPVHAPSAYAFVREFGQQWSHYFTGQHSSAATVMSAKNAQIAQVGGMNSNRGIKNTYRITPPYADAQGVDETPATGAYVSRARTYRLG